MDNATWVTIHIPTEAEGLVAYSAARHALAEAGFDVAGASWDDTKRQGYRIFSESWEATEENQRYARRYKDLKAEQRG